MIPRFDLLFAAQARFPAPEFEAYTLPKMSLEELASDSVLWRVLLLAVFLAAGTWFFYKLRSRKALLAYSVAGLAVFGFLFASCPCPVGMFQNVAEGIANGSYIQPGVLLLFALPLAIALFAGRVFCGGACPLGAIQELLHWKSVFVPRPLDRILRLIPVLLLLIFTVCVIYGIGFPLCYLEPYLPIFLLDFATPFAILSAVFLAAGLFISRPFCRYVCPYGVLLRFFSYFSLLKPQITSHECVNCRLCEQGCPNGAILPPEGTGSTSEHRSGFRRISMLTALIPFALFAGGLFGYFCAPILSSFHRDVRLVRELDAGIKSEAVEAFESTTTTREELRARAIQLQNGVLLASTAAGVLFGAVVMAELIAEARRRKEEEVYTIDPSLCFCCGRCYAACPLERKEKHHEK